VITEGETITNDSEYEQNDKDVGCGLSEIEVHVSGENQRLPNNQGNSNEKSDDSVVMFTKQLEVYGKCQGRVQGLADKKPQR
jgi:hypothetical protein